jgi:hypothetical protein
MGSGCVHVGVQRKKGRNACRGPLPCDAENNPLLVFVDDGCTGTAVARRAGCGRGVLFDGDSPTHLQRCA